jgi:hypothetical protein
VQAGLVPLARAALVDEARRCVSVEQLGEVEADRLHGDAGGREGQGAGCVAVGAGGGV